MFNIISKWIKKRVFSDEVIDVLPSEDYAITGHDKFYTLSYKGNLIGGFVPIFPNKNSAVRFCWKHWKELSF